MSHARITALRVTNGYVEFDLMMDGTRRNSVVIKQDVIEEHALRHSMSAVEIRNYVAAHFDAFADAVKRAGGFYRRIGDVVVIDRIDELEPESMRRFG